MTGSSHSRVTPVRPARMVSEARLVPQDHRVRLAISRARRRPRSASSTAARQLYSGLVQPAPALLASSLTSRPRHRRADDANRSAVNLEARLSGLYSLWGALALPFVFHQRQRVPDAVAQYRVICDSLEIPLGTSLILVPTFRARRDASVSIGMYADREREPATTGSPGKSGPWGCQQSRPYKQEVTGSSPVPPTCESPGNAAVCIRRARRLDAGDGRVEASWKPLSARESLRWSYAADRVTLRSIT